MYTGKPYINNLSFFAIMVVLLTMLCSCSEDQVIQKKQASAKEPSKAVSKVPNNNKLAYILSDKKIPFWNIMGRGATSGASTLGYKLEVYSSDNNTQRELTLVKKAIKDNVSGIIVSPTTSSNCVNILHLANEANIPVVISDVGTDGGEYVSYISSNNEDGAYAIGKVLTQKMRALSWEDGKVGIIAIPQKRLNGQARTAGFLHAMQEAGIMHADIKEQVTFSEDETYLLCKELIDMHPDLRALWLQGSDKYKGALKAISDTGKEGNILLITFDAEPEFTELISNGTIVGSAMQQPYLMGKGAVYTMDRHLNGRKVDKELKLPILAVYKENIGENLTMIKRNVLGIGEQ